MEQTNVQKKMLDEKQDKELLISIL